MAKRTKTKKRRVILSPDYSINLLVIAAVGQAKREAARGDLKARMWLESEGIAWFDACGLNCNLIADWLKNPPAPPEEKPSRTNQDERNGPGSYQTSASEPRARVLICSYA